MKTKKMYAVSSFVCNDDGTTEVKHRSVFEKITDATNSFDNQFKYFNVEYGGELELISTWREAREGRCTCVFGNTDYVIFLTIKPLEVVCES